MIYLVIAGIVCSVFMIGFMYKEMSLLKAITLGITGYFFVYVLSSGMLFWMERYSTTMAAVCALMILLAIALILALKEKRIPLFVYNFKEWAVLLIVLVFVFPATIEKFEYFGMGQDQGVYQTKAIELMNGNNQRIFDFEEINVLETAAQKKSYIKTVEMLTGGYDLVAGDIDKPFLRKLADITETAGIYHGIPTWPSVLALFGEMFGLAQMQSCQSLFLIILMMLVFYILENLKIKTVLEVPALLLLGLSPQVLWVSKSALAEMFLAVIISCFILLITEREKSMRFFSCVPVFVFSFYHITIYTMLPMFMMLYWGLYVISRERKYIWAANVSVLGYFIGFLFMVYISPRYAFNNYVWVIDKFLAMNDDALLIVVPIVSLLALVFTNLLPMMMRVRKFRELRRVVYEKRDVLLRAVILILLCIFAIMCVTQNVTWGTLGSLTLIVYARATGIVLLPITLILLLLSQKAKKIGEIRYVIVLAFIYAILVYSVAFIFKNAYYYYYGRYMMPYLCVVIVTFCYFVNRMKLYHFWLFCLLGGVSFALPNKLLVTELDDTNMTWEVLEKVTSLSDGESTAVVVGEEYVRLLFLPLKSEGIAVYNCWDDMAAEMEFLSTHYEDVYYVGQENLSEEDYYVAYRDMYVRSEYQLTEEQNESKYPLGIKSEEMKITLYRYKDMKLKYHVNDEEFEGSGFGTIENGTYAWTNKESVAVVCYLVGSDYRVSVTQGEGIPLGVLGLTEYPIKVYVNGEYLTLLNINESNNGGVLAFEIPESMLSGRRNVISFESELWRLSDYGLNDDRNIGFSFSAIEFGAL